MQSPRSDDNGGYDAAREIAHLYPRAVLLRDRRIVAENAWRAAA